MGWLFRAALIFSICCSLFGAEHYGYVRSGKKAIPGATVTAAFDKYKLVTTTDENGVYIFDIPDHGKWAFTAEMFGFATATEERTLSGVASVLDFDLELQAGTPTDTVAAAATPGFQTVDVKEIDPTQIAEQMEASAAPSAPSMAGTGGDVNSAFLVNGSLSGGLQSVQQQNFFDQLDQEQSPVKKQKKAKADLGPGAKRAKKAAKKAKKKKSAADTVASFGATKQENQIRGNLLYTFRDSAFDGKSYSLSGQPFEKPSYQQSRIGAAAGGPLPGHPQSIFFLNFTAVRSSVPYSGFDTVPTLEERAGNFTQPTAAGPVILYDPVSHLPLNNNTIPVSRIDKISTALLNYIPAPNLPGNLMNYQFNTAVPLNTIDFSAKLNHTLNDKNRLNFSFAVQHRSGQQAQLFGFQDTLDGLGWQGDVGWSHNFGPRTINSLHYAFSRNRNNVVPFFSNGVNVAKNIGIQGTSQDPLNYGPPNLLFTNFGNMSDGSPSVKRDQSSAIRESLTLVRGVHNLNIGGEYRRIQSNPVTDTNGRGAFVFSGLLTTAFDDNGKIIPGTGLDFADFLFGFPNVAKVRFGSAANYFRSWATSAYIVDDWKVRSNLSLNVGLRYEYFSPYVEKYDRMSNLDLASGITGAAVVTPGQSGPYSGVFPRALIDGSRRTSRRVPPLRGGPPRSGILWCVPDTASSITAQSTATCPGGWRRSPPSRRTTIFRRAF